jgi:hypothetical protein
MLLFASYAEDSQEFEVGYEDGTGSGTCPVLYFGISAVESSVYAVWNKRKK